MKQRALVIRWVVCLALLAMGTLTAPTGADTTAPAETVKLIFIHHSTGEYWLMDGHGNLGGSLMNNNYYVSDTNYGWGPDTIGDTTDIGHWYTWFRGANRDTYMAALFTESDNHCSDCYTRMAGDPGGENRIILFKPCFPNSLLGGSPDDPATTGDNPLRGQDAYTSEYMTVANAKGIYNDILEYFATRQDKLFIAVTPPPETEANSDPTYAANARAFSNWLVNDWLDGYAHDNVAVFDLFNVLAGSDNFAAYPMDQWDAHPNATGCQNATAAFIPFINTAYNAWADGGSTGGTPPTVATGSSSDLTDTSATLTGTVNPNGDGTCYFQYGTDTTYGSATTGASVSGTAETDVSADLTGLSPQTTYHYRLVAANSAGTSYGDDATFTTSAAAIPSTGANVPGNLWIHAVLKVSSGDVALRWHQGGDKTSPTGDRTIWGYFYADPQDFSYGSTDNPEVFVKVYIASNGWRNIAFNHVTVDDVDVYSAYHYDGTADQTGLITLDSRVAAHPYEP